MQQLLNLGTCPENVYAEERWGAKQIGVLLTLILFYSLGVTEA